jgi:hypothetical protein
MREGKCFYCKETGHILQNCPKRKKTIDPKISELEATEERKERKD